MEYENLSSSPPRSAWYLSTDICVAIMNTTEYTVLIYNGIGPEIGSLVLGSCAVDLRFERALHR